MGKPDSYVDEKLTDILFRAAGGISNMAEKEVAEIKQLFADFYRNKIPEKKNSDLASMQWHRHELIGYNQAIDDITAQFNSKETK